MLKTPIALMLLVCTSAVFSQSAVSTFPAGTNSPKDIESFPEDERIKVTITPPKKSALPPKNHQVSIPPTQKFSVIPTQGVSPCVGNVYVNAEMPSDIPIHTSKNIIQLTELNNGGKTPVASRASGLGLGSTVAKQTVLLEWKKAPGSQCLDANVTIGYKSIAIHIARELLKNPCAYQHVLDHEKHHVYIYRRALMEWQMKGPTEWKQPLQNALVKNEDPMSFFQQLLSAVKEEHEAFDSEEEYEKNELVCNTYIRRLIKRL